MKIFKTFLDLRQVATLEWVHLVLHTKVLISLSIPHIFRIRFNKIFAGILIKADRSEKEVAMKFTEENYKYEAAKEYKMYTYLHAINNELVEQYGIPTVYYFGKWANFFLMAITLLDTSVKSIIGNVNELDGLIMFRDFVSKIKF